MARQTRHKPLSFDCKCHKKSDWSSCLGEVNVSRKQETHLTIPNHDSAKQMTIWSLRCLSTTPDTTVTLGGVRVRKGGRDFLAAWLLSKARASGLAKCFNGSLDRLRGRSAFLCISGPQILIGSPSCERGLPRLPQSPGLLTEDCIP
jgi:hypothetical protein